MTTLVLIATLVSWQYVSPNRILDTQLVNDRVLAVLESNRHLRILQTADGNVITESRTGFAFLDFAEQIPANRDTHRLVLCTLAGCQPHILMEGTEGQSLEQGDFIPIVDPELPKADPEFNDRVLKAWVYEEKLITLTSRGRLAHRSLGGSSPPITFELGMIGAWRSAIAPHQLALTWKRGPTIQVARVRPTDFARLDIIRLPEASIPQEIQLSPTLLVAKYPTRTYAVPVSPLMRRYWPLIEFPISNASKPVKQHMLPDAIIRTSDRQITLERTN